MDDRTLVIPRDTQVSRTAASTVSALKRHYPLFLSFIFQFVLFFLH